MLSIHRHLESIIGRILGCAVDTRRRTRTLAGGNCTGMTSVVAEG
jgi:hypothetical protein